jgi:hypothetical protein
MLFLTQESMKKKILPPKYVFFPMLLFKTFLQLAFLYLLIASHL